MLGWPSHASIISTASFTLKRWPGNLEFVVIRRKAVTVCQGIPTGSLLEKVSSIHARAFACSEVALLYA